MSINTVNTNVNSNRSIRDSQVGNNTAIHRPRTSSFNASTVNATSTTQNSNKPLAGYTNFADWKADRADLFAKYSEAGEKVSVPTTIRILTPISNNIPTARQPGQDSFLNRGGPTSTTMLNCSPAESPSIINRNPSQGNDPVKTPGDTSLSKVPEQEVRVRYGNYFVYKIESFLGKIMRSEESIKANQKNIEFNEINIANSNDEASNKTSRSIIASAEAAISESEAKIKGTLGQMLNWAEKNGVMEETKSFIAEFTKDFYNNPQTLESMQAA